MKLERHTVLHRKDERGVIVESGVFGPDDEVPKGFEKAGSYERPADTERKPVALAESKLTPWEKPVSTSFVKEDNDAVKEALGDVEEAAGVDKTEAEENPGEESDSSKGRGRRSNRS